MMRPSYTQSYENPGYPQSIPNYWGGYPQQMPYYQQPMQPYPYQMAGDHVIAKTGRSKFVSTTIFSGATNDNWNESRTNNSAAISTTVSATLYQQPYQQPYFSQPQSAQPFNPFDNPLQPQVKRPPQQYANPYPQQQFMQKAQPSGFQSVLNQFKTQDGSVDVTKMMNTAGQMVNTFSQMSNVFKGVGGLFKLKV